MLFFGIIIFCNLLTLFVVFGCYNAAAKPNGHMLMSVTLPAVYLADSAVTEIATQYKKRCAQIFIVLLPISFGFYFIRNYAAVTTVFLLIYCFAIIISYCITLEYYRKKLLALKKARNWSVTKMHILSIDTEVSRLKNTFPVSRKHYILPLAIYAFVLLLYYYAERETLISNALAAFTTLLIPVCGMVMYEIFARLPSRIYCENSEANIALNRSYKRECSKMCVSFVYSGLAMLPMVIFPITHENYGIIVLVSAFVSSVIPICVLFAAFFNVRRERNKFMHLITSDIEIDDDEFWHYGFYCNPNDKKIFVESRVGFGLDLNFSAPAAKIVGVIIGVSLAFVFGLFIFLIPIDFIDSFELQQNGNEFSIKAPLYSDTFMKEDIETVEKVSELKNVTRINGAGTANYSLGNYTASGYGKCRMYVKKDVKQYIVIQLENDTCIILNGESIAQTEKFYAMLCE